MRGLFMVGASGTEAKAVRPETAVALTRVIPPAALKKFRRETDMLFSPLLPAGDAGRSARP